MSVMERPDPIPGHGQLLVKVLRCGICGSDLHVRDHCDHWGRMMRSQGYRALIGSNHEMVFGHEFSAEVIAAGPGTRTRLKPGRAVVALPLIRRGEDVDLLGLSAQSPGAYAERVVVQECMTMPIPNGLPAADAALTDPMATGLHAVLRGEVKCKDVAIVVGCGPVGLAVICMLKAKGVRKIIASDFSPQRRAMAARCGATLVVDPGMESPCARWQELGFIPDVSGAFELGMSSKERLNKLPFPWWHLWSVGERLGIGKTRPVIFECVGVPGILQSIIASAPQFSRIVVVGVCMQTDAIEPAMAINKEIDIRFSLGYTPLDFRQALHMMADGDVDAAPLITGTVGLHGVESMFDVLAQTPDHVKVLIDPSLAEPEGLCPPQRTADEPLSFHSS